MLYRDFCKAFMVGVIPPWEPTDEVLRSKHLVVSALLREGKVEATKAHAYVVKMAKNWSIDQLRRSEAEKRRASASKEAAEGAARYESAVEAFLLALDSVELTLERPVALESAELTRRIIAGESVPDLQKRFGLSKDNLYKRVSRVREMVVLTGALSPEQEKLLLTESGRFRPQRGIVAEVNSLRKKVR